jgi:choline/glycine/proline betaine transport protein
LLKERADGTLGNLIDILAVVATLFGLATSLGFGVQQVSAGLRHLFGLETTALVQISLVAGVTAIAGISVASGMHSGVKRLSELNIRIGAVLLAFIFIAGPTVFILDSYMQNLGGYLDSFFDRSFWTESYTGGQWQNNWTIFYWAWWISWSPFVGMFIARISKGRTIREFVLSVLVIPSLLTFFWINAFGGTAVSLQMEEAVQVAARVKDQVAISLFVLLEQFPLAALTSGVAMLLVISFFVTSADSGSLVVDSFASGGKLNTPLLQRIFWTGTEGAVAVALLLGGGLGALQAASISTGLPFAVVLGIMSVSLLRGLENEHLRLVREEQEQEKESYQDIISDIVRRRTGRQASAGQEREHRGESDADQSGGEDGDRQ